MCIDGSKWQLLDLFQKMPVFSYQHTQSKFLQMSCHCCISKLTAKPLILADGFQVGFVPTKKDSIRVMLQQTKQRCQFVSGKIRLQLLQYLARKNNMKLPEPIQETCAGWYLGACPTMPLFSLFDLVSS